MYYLSLRRSNDFWLLVGRVGLECLEHAALWEVEEHMYKRSFFVLLLSLCTSGYVILALL